MIEVDAMSHNCGSTVPLSLLIALLVACGGSGSSGSSSSGSSGTDGSGTSTSDTSDTSGSSGLSTGSGAPTTSTGTTGTTGVAQEVTTELVRYMTQPQVVDVVVTTSVATDAISLTHPLDPGVVIEEYAVDGLARTFRVRGLAVDTEHSLQYAVDELAGTVDFITYPGLPGFIPTFEVEGGGVDPARPYRMFDLIPFPAFDTSSVFMVDGQGTTRWHLGGPSTKVPGPEGVWTAVTQRADGTIMFLHDHTMWIRDELGATVLEISDDMLGVTGLHHELLELPSGNFMALSFVFQDVDYGAAGVLQTAGDSIVEFTPAGELVWTWDSFDHLDPQRVTEPFTTVVIHPETQASTYDWTHGNGVVYDAASDTLLLSLRHQDWVIKIDHKTGEVLWKLGPDGDFAFADDAAFYHQHAPEWQSDGSLLLYDNGVGDPGLAPAAVQSRAVRYALDYKAMTATRVWTDDGEPILVPFAGNVDRLPGGRILVTDSSITGMNGFWARLRELDAGMTPMLQWSLRTPDQSFAYRGTAHERLIGQVAP